MNLKSRVNRVEDAVKSALEDKVIIVGYSDAEIEKKKREYATNNHGPVCFVCIKIVFDDYITKKGKEL